MYTKIVLLAGLLAVLTGCSFIDVLSGKPQNFWIDANGARHEVIFTDGPVPKLFGIPLSKLSKSFGVRVTGTGTGSDLFDAYNACGKEMRCYRAYFAMNEFNYKPRFRGKIRVSSRGSSSIIYAEYNMDRWTDEILAPFCFLALRLDDAGNIIEAEYEAR